MGYWIVWHWDNPDAPIKRIGEIIAYDNPVLLVKVMGDEEGDVRPAKLKRLNADDPSIRIFDNYSAAGSYFRSI